MLPKNQNIFLSGMEIHHMVASCSSQGVLLNAVYAMFRFGTVKVSRGTVIRRLKKIIESLLVNPIGQLVHYWMI